MATKTVFITTPGSSTFTVPVDFGSLVSIEAIGGGGGSRTASKAPGSGAGAYAYSIISTGLAPGVVLNAYVGNGGSPGTSPTGGEASYLNDGVSTTYISADYGKASSATVAGAGGNYSNCIGTGPHHSGGSGGAASTTYAKGGGGGAGGP